MKIDSALVRYLAFHPRKVGKRTYFPIFLPITGHDFLVDCHTGAANSALTSIAHGCNGEVNAYEDKFIIKKLFSPDKASHYDPDRELKAMVSLEVNDMSGLGIPNGFYGYRNEYGDTFVVSQKLQGANPNHLTNKFNHENLSMLIRTIAKTDTPDKYWNHLKPYQFRTPFSHLMHYDIKGGNLLIDEKYASIIDWEYLDFVNIFNGIKNRNWGVINNYSDVPNIPSNLRNFEYRTLLPYIEKLGKNNNEAKELFRDYLKLKSEYYERVHLEYDFVKNKLPKFKILKKLFNIKTNIDVCDEIIESQNAQKRVLENLTDDIVKAEAMKIQIARFIYLLSTSSHGDETIINLKQIKNYITEAHKLFMEKEACCDGDLKIYYRDSRKLLDIWKGIIPIIETNSMKEKLSYYNDILHLPKTTKNNDSVDMKETVYSDKIQTTFDKLVL